MEQMVKVNVSGDIAALEIRKGEALPLKEPNKVIIKGNIDAITRYLRPSKTKENLVDIRCAFVAVDRDKMMMTFYDDPRDHYGMEIVASLETSEAFKKFGINSNKSWTSFELADFIRMNRSYFEKRQDALDLVTTLRNFEAKINKEVENSDDKRGNVKVKRQQAVQSNLPREFNLKISLFKGEEPITLTVEIDINADDLSCRLVSPTAAEWIQSGVNGRITTEISIVQELYADLVIIEQ